MTYEGKYPLRRPEKRTQSNPIFKFGPPAKRRPRTPESQVPCHGLALRHVRRSASEVGSPKGEGGSRALILQNKPNLQKCETNRNLCVERTYETATARNSRKNKANLQKCKNEPNHLFANNLRKITLVNSVDLAYNSAQFESTNAAFALFREQFETIGANSRQVVLSQEPVFKSEGKSGSKQ
jgi:hypothetical protein